MREISKHCSKLKTILLLNCDLVQAISLCIILLFIVCATRAGVPVTEVPTTVVSVTEESASGNIPPQFVFERIDIDIKGKALVSENSVPSSKE